MKNSIKMLGTIVLSTLFMSNNVNADWLLNGEIEPPPIEDIKGEVGSDMKFGFVKGIFALPAKIIGDAKVNDRIKATEEGRNTKVVTVGEVGAAVAMTATASVAGGAITGGKLAAQVADLTTKVEKTDKYLQYQDNAIKALENTQKYQDKLIEKHNEQLQKLDYIEKNFDALAEKVYTPK